MIVSKKIILLFVSATMLFTCSGDEPQIDQQVLIIGTWHEASATDVYTDYKQPQNNTNTNLTNSAYSITFNEDLTFTMWLATLKIDSGTHFFKVVESKNNLYTVTADNPRIPKDFNFERKISEYQIIHLSKNRLKLRAHLSSIVNNDELLIVRDFSWDLNK